MWYCYPRQPVLTRLLSVLQRWRQPRVGSKQWPGPAGIGQSSSDPLWYPAHHVLRLSSRAHQPVRRLHRSVFFTSLICQPLSLWSVSYSSHSLYSLSESAPKRLSDVGGKQKSAVSRCPAGFCFKEQTTNQRSHSSRLSNQQTSTVKPLRALSAQKTKKKPTKKHTYDKLSHYFAFVFSIWMSALVFVRYTERGSELTVCVSAAL